MNPRITAPKPWTTLLCEVPPELMFRMIEETPAFGRHVIKIVRVTPSAPSARGEQLLGKSAPARLAHAILHRSQQHGIADREGVLIPLRLTQGDLGKLVGLTRETVNGILHAWRHQGVVEMDRRSIRIHDAERLRRSAIATSEAGGRYVSCTTGLVAPAVVSRRFTRRSRSTPG